MHMSLWLLLNINRETYVGNPMALSNLTLSDIESQSQGHQTFETLYLAKEPG